MSCPVPGLAELFEKPLKKISFPRELEKRVYLYSYHFLQKNHVKSTTEQKTKKQKEKSLGNFVDKNNFVNKKQKKGKKKRKKIFCKKSDNALEELDYKSIQKNGDNTINSASYESDTDKNPSLILPDKKTINTHKWPNSLQSKKYELLAINARSFENVSKNIDFDLVGSLLGDHKLKTDCNSPSINFLKRKRKADENIVKHVNIQDEVHASRNDGITGNQDIRDVIPKEKKSENAIGDILIPDSIVSSKKKQFEETSKHLSNESSLEHPLVTDINITRCKKQYIHPVTYKNNHPVISDASNTSNAMSRSCEYIYKRNRNFHNEQPVRRNTRSMSRGLSQEQQHFNAESNWSEKLMDLVAGSPMETEVIPSSRESCKRDVAIPRRGRKKSKKSAESTKAYWAKRRLEIQREKEKREYDAKMPCVFYKKHGECSYGDLCRFSHDIEVDKGRECCKYYVVGACLKGNDCRFFHSEWPCKFFHISKFCSNGDSCKFSHAEMTQEIKELFDARILYEESLKNTEKSSTNPAVSLHDGSGIFVDDKMDAVKTIEEEKAYNSNIEIEETRHSPKKVDEFHFPSLYYELP